MNTSIKLLKPLLGPMLAVIFMFGLITSASADDVPHRVVIQVSTDDPRTQTLAMNNAVNLQKLYGIDNVEIEIVAYGPGLDMMTKKSKFADRVKSLAVQDITFSACENTMNAMKKKTGKLPELTEGVGTVKAGVGRLMELHEEGYTYIRP